MRRRVIDHRSARFGVPEAGVAHVCIPGKRCRHSKGPRVAGCEIGTYVFNCIRSTCDPALIGRYVSRFAPVPAYGPVEEARDAPPSHRAHPRRGQGSAHAGPGPGTVSDSTHVDWVEWRSHGRNVHGISVLATPHTRGHTRSRDPAAASRVRTRIRTAARLRICKRIAAYLLPPPKGPTVRHAADRASELLDAMLHAAYTPLAVLRVQSHRGYGAHNSPVLRPQPQVLRSQHPAVLRSPGRAAFAGSPGPEATKRERASQPTSALVIDGVPSHLTREVFTPHERRQSHE